MTQKDPKKPAEGFEILTFAHPKTGEPVEIQFPAVWPYTIKLKKPIELERGAPIAELRFREGRAGDAGNLNPTGSYTIEQILEVAALQCDQPVAVLKRLSMRDTPRVVEHVSAFLLVCLGGGSAPSEP